MRTSPLVRLQPLHGMEPHAEASVELVELGRAAVRAEAVDAGPRRRRAAVPAGAGGRRPAPPGARHASIARPRRLAARVCGRPHARRQRANAGALQPLGRGGIGHARQSAPTGSCGVDSMGQVVPGSWPELVERLIERGLTKARASDLPAALLEIAAARLGELRDFTPDTFVLVHGDLHANNVLLRGDDAILFDRASRYWSGPAVFDVALIHSEGFPLRYGVQRPNGERRGLRRLPGGLLRRPARRRMAGPLRPRPQPDALPQPVRPGPAPDHRGHRRAARRLV